MAVLALVAALPVHGDQEVWNSAHVVGGDYGRCYAKSVPSESYRGKGVTRVFRVSDSEDALVQSYNWFSQQIHIACNLSNGLTPTGISVVRFGPWARGHRASADQLAIAFYFKGGTLKEYSTLDIAGCAENVSASVSHYTVIEEVIGYRWLGGNRASFDVKTTDGKTLSFDPATGEFRKSAEAGRQLGR